MNRFTQEYIELCKSEKVQGLKKKYYQGDWIIPKDKKMMVNIFDGIERLDYLWLPTGDQLDDEIEKICKKEHGIYDFKYCPNLDIYKAEISLTKSCNFVEAVKHNPLIAKIQLLIKLLGNNNG